MKLRAIPRPVEVDPDVERKRVELESELFRTGMSAPFPSAPAIAAYNARLADLKAQLKALPPRAHGARPTGMEAGSYVTADTRLGDGPVDGRASDEFTYQHEYDPWEGI